eukprot:Skav222008  [mRNA]  locus=scaffold2020:264250:264561:- [translate_table: standard]
MKRSDGWLLCWLLYQCLEADAQALRRSLQGGTSTFTATTVTTTSDPCIGALDGCACAAGKVCGWSVFANGGGICLNRGQPTEIDCFLCPSQEKHGETCPLDTG